MLEFCFGLTHIKVGIFYQIELICSTEQGPKMVMIMILWEQWDYFK